MARELLINVAESEECRVAVVEDGSLEELTTLSSADSVSRRRRICSSSADDSPVTPTGAPRTP